MYEQGKFSDLPFRVESDYLVVAKPNLNKDFDIKLELAKYGNVRNSLFTDALHFVNLQHVGSLHCDNYNGADGPGEPIRYIECSGILKVESAGRYWDSHEWISGWAKSVLTCSSKECHMLLATFMTKPEMQSVMLHLMLKQVIPTLEICNFVDCNFELINEVPRDLGLIAVHSELFTGLVDNTYFRTMCRVREKFGFGFILQPGMNTRNGHDGYDVWVNFLVQKKFDELKELHSRSLARLIGPRSLKGSRLGS